MWEKRVDNVTIIKTKKYIKKKIKKQNHFSKFSYNRTVFHLFPSKNILKLKVKVTQINFFVNFFVRNSVFPTIHT